MSMVQEVAHHEPSACPESEACKTREMGEVGQVVARIKGDFVNCLCVDCGEDFDADRGLRHPPHGGGRCLHLRCWLARRGL